MRAKVAILLLCITLTSCFETRTMSSFVCEYYICINEAPKFDIVNGSKHNLPANYIALDIGPDLGFRRIFNYSGKAFDALSEKHNDMTYNRKYAITEGPTTDGNKFGAGLAHDFVSLSVVSDADWDNKHPAGESLCDICRYHAHTYMPFILNNYRGEASKMGVIDILASQVTPEDMMCLDVDMTRIGGIINLEFNIPPTISKKHNITITLVADDGKVFINTIEMNFE